MAETKSINDQLILSAKSLQSGGNIPFPSYGTGWGASRIWESEAQWSSWNDSMSDGGINHQKYRMMLGDLSRNSLMCAAIRFLGDSLLEAPVQVKEKKGGLSGKKGESKIIEDHKLPALWNRPNDYYDGTRLKKAIAFSLVLASNSYIIKVFSENGLWPLELWWEPHWTIRPVFPVNGSEFISHYEVNRNGMWYPIATENVIHIADGIHPYNQRLGFSGNDSISPELYADAEAGNYYASLLGGSGVPQFMVGIDKGMKMDQPKAEAMEKMIRRKTTGADKGQPFVIGGGRAYKLGISPKDLDLRDSRYAAEDRFCAVQGIPAVVLELGSGHAHSIYNTVKQAEERAWKGYVCPKLTLLEAALDHSLLTDFEDVTPGKALDRYCEHDLSQVQALQEDLDEKAKRLTGLFEKGGIMRSELRSGMNYGPSMEGDVDVDKVFFVLKGGSLVKPNEEPLAQGEQIIDMITGEIRAGAPPPQPSPFGDPNALPGQAPENALDASQTPDKPLLSLAKALVGDGLKGGPGSGPHPSAGEGEYVPPVHTEETLLIDSIIRNRGEDRGEAYSSGLNKSGHATDPITVTRDLKGDLLLIDGHHRLELARQKGESTIRADVITIQPRGTKSLEFSQAIQDLLPDGFLNPQAGWINFPSEMNSLNIPRTSMPQVMSNHRGAMVQFLRGRGITHSKEDVLPNTLSPTQAEYRPDKVESAKNFEGTDRPILVSADNRVVDGHHQWMAAMDSPDEPIPVIKLDKEIVPLLLEVARFPSSGVKDEEDNLQFWNRKSMPSGKVGVSSADVTATIAYLRKHRYEQAAQLMSAKPMEKPAKKSNGDAEILST